MNDRPTEGEPGFGRDEDLEAVRAGGRPAEADLDASAAKAGGRPVRVSPDPDDPDGGGPA